MLTSEVRQYIDQCVAQGMTLEAVSGALAVNGWAEADIKTVREADDSALF